METLKEYMARKEVRLAFLYEPAALAKAQEWSFFLGRCFRFIPIALAADSPRSSLQEAAGIVDRENVDIVLGEGVGAFFALLLKNVCKLVIDPEFTPSAAAANPDFKALEAELFENVDAEERCCTIGLFTDERQKAIFDRHYNLSQMVEADKHRQAFSCIYHRFLDPRQQRNIAAAAQHLL